ncbi:MAG: 2'-5' RNA ligase family protein [Williamsia sp.]|nr:2'-5' RNA ligase family protein [Williamsia sp.]
MPALPPLILSCLLDPEAAHFFNGLRKKHFPPEKNFLDAHLTLFHHLPGEPSLFSGIEELCSRQAVINLAVQEVVFIGKGVAYRIESPVLKQLHKSLQQQWKEWLTPQDKQGLWPHVTVQNKVAPETARQLQKELAERFVAFETTARGLQLWEYLGGPWKPVKTFLFTAR